MTDTTSTALPRALSPSLFLFTIIYGGMVVLAGVLGNKQVEQAIIEGQTLNQVIELSQTGVEDFAKRRQPFLLYR